MTWTPDPFDRPTLSRDAFRAVSVGGRPQADEPTLIAGRPFRPICHMRVGRAAGSESLFAAERRAGLRQVADDEMWAAFRSTAEIDAAERMREDNGTLWVPDRLGQEHRFFELPDGRMEYEIILPREPDGGVFPVAVASSHGVQWWHQGELTQEEIDEGSVRPEDVIDSWAVYGPRQGNWRRVDGTPVVEYGIGKLVHVYRPWIASVARLAERRWCTWVVVDGIPVGIRIPPGVRYPAILGPTFGYDAVGLTQSYLGLNYLFYNYYSAPAVNGTLDTIDYYQPGVQSETWRVALYDDTADNNRVRLGQSAENTSAATGWVTTAIPGSVGITSGVVYSIGIWTKTLCYIQYDVAGGTRGYRTLTYNATNDFPNPWGTPDNVAERNYSFRGTYTESGVGPVIPVFMNSYRHRWS